MLKHDQSSFILMIMNRFVAIGEASRALGVSVATLRRWEAAGRITSERTSGRQRRYDLTKLQPELLHGVHPALRHTIAYTRVVSADQQDSLTQQKQALELYCARQGWTFEVITDIGSGLNYHHPGLHHLINAIFEGRVGRLVLDHRDRLLRLGSELVFAICAAKNVEILILNLGTNTPFEADLASDILEMTEIFSARLYSGRSQHAQALIDRVRQAVTPSE